MKQYVTEIFFLLGKDRVKLVGLLLIFLTSSLIELIGIGLIGPYISAIINPGDEIMISFYNFLDKFKIIFTHQYIIVFLSIGLLIIFLIKSAMMILINYVVINFSNLQNKKIRTKLMQSYQSYSYNLYIERNSSEYIQAALVYAGAYTSSLHRLIKMVSESIITMFIVGFLAWMNWMMVLLFIVLLGLYIFGFDKVFRKVLKKAGEMQNRYNIISIQAIQEGIKGFKEIRILGKEKHFEKLVEETTGNSMHYATRSAVISSSPRSIIESIIVAFIVTIVLSIHQMGESLISFIPLLAMFGAGILRLIPAATFFSSSFSVLHNNRFAVSRLFKDLSFSHDNIYEFKNKSLAHKDTEIQFNNFSLKSVYFSYPKSDSWVLKDVSMNIKSGDSIGIIGPSGSGKTTLIDVLLGLLEPQQGEMFFNGATLRESLVEWRSQCAYLPQEVFITDNSLRRNVALGISDSNIDDKRLFEALRQARLNTFLDQLSDGVETMLGEHGIRLSGGQRQRVALARAFYHKRNVLIMDEATSALDNETEQEIIDEIKHFKGEKTLIVIAHRLTTVQNCNCIYRIEDGQIAEKGTLEEITKSQVKCVNV